MQTMKIFLLIRKKEVSRFNDYLSVSSINIDRRRTLLATITLCDFIIVNLVAWLIFLELGSDIPAYFHTYTRIVVALMNVSVLISDFFSQHHPFPTAAPGRRVP